MNRVLAVLAIAVLGVFLGILVWHVPRLDLGIVAGITFLIAAYDIILAAPSANG